MATQPKKPASYDLKAVDRRRNIVIQVGLTAIVVIVAVALMFYVVNSGDGDEKSTGTDAKQIRVTSSKLMTKEGTTEPKAVLGLYEDFLCPVCNRFEQQFGPAIANLIDNGAIAADYYMVAILDRPTNQNYSSGPPRPPTVSPTRTPPPTSKHSDAFTPRSTPNSPARRARRSPPMPNSSRSRARPPSRARHPNASTTAATSTWPTVSPRRQTSPAPRLSGSTARTTRPRRPTP